MRVISTTAQLVDSSFEHFADAHDMNAKALRLTYRYDTGSAGECIVWVEPERNVRSLEGKELLALQAGDRIEVLGKAATLSAVEEFKS
jgi:hypothetical protein